MPGIVVPIMQWVQTIKVDIHQILVMHRKVLIHRCKTACICGELQAFHNSVGTRVRPNQTTSPKDHADIQELLALIKNLYNLFLMLGQNQYLNTVLTNPINFVEENLRTFRIKFNKLVIGLRFSVVDPLPINESQMVIDDIADCTDLIERLKACEEEGVVPPEMNSVFSSKMKQIEEKLEKYDQDEEESQKSALDKVRILSQDEIDKQLMGLKPYIFRHTDFELKKIIGHGGFASVFWSYQYVKGSSNKIVAVKKLKANHFTQYSFEMFKREIQILSEMHHPAILQFIGIVPSPPYYIATEFMEGGCLYNRLHAREPLRDPTKLTIIALGIAYAMRYLHSKRLIHRDLKSLNVLLDANDYPKVCDFGMSRLIPEGSEVMSGSIGTAQWMAPEVMRSDHYTEKADVYSFGILLWELLTGDVPFRQMRDVQVTLAVLSNNARPLMPTNASPRLAKLIRVCWDSDPEVRPDFATIVKMFESGELNFPGTRDDEVLAYKSIFREEAEEDAQAPAEVSDGVIREIIAQIGDDAEQTVAALAKLKAIAGDPEWAPVARNLLPDAVIKALKASDDVMVTAAALETVAAIIASAELSESFMKAEGRNVVLEAIGKFASTKMTGVIAIVRQMIANGSTVSAECFTKLGPFLAVPDLELRKEAAQLLDTIIRTRKFEDEGSLAAIVHNVIMNAIPESHPTLLVPIISLIDALCDYPQPLSRIRVSPDSVRYILQLATKAEDTIAGNALAVLCRITETSIPPQDTTIAILKAFPELAKRPQKILANALAVFAITLRSQAAYKMIATSSEVVSAIERCLDGEGAVAVFALKIVVALLMNASTFSVIGKCIEKVIGLLNSEVVPVSRLAAFAVILFVEKSDDIPNVVINNENTKKYLIRAFGKDGNSLIASDALRLVGVLSQFAPGVAFIEKCGIINAVCKLTGSEDAETARFATMAVSAFAVQYPFEEHLTQCVSRMLDMIEKGVNVRYAEVFVASVSVRKEAAIEVADRVDIVLKGLGNSPHAMVALQNIVSYPRAIHHLLRSKEAMMDTLLKELDYGQSDSERIVGVINVITQLSHSTDAREIMVKAGIGKKIRDMLWSSEINSIIRSSLLLVTGRLGCTNILE